MLNDSEATSKICASTFQIIRGFIFINFRV